MYYFKINTLIGINEGEPEREPNSFCMKYFGGCLYQKNGVPKSLAVARSLLRQDEPFIKQMLVLYCSVLINTIIDNILLVSEAHVSLFHSDYCAVFF